MAITFPRATPAALKVVGLTFVPDPMIEVTPLRSGRQVSVDLGPTLWRAQYQSRQMPEDELGELRAWYDTLLSLRSFYGYDVLREYPLAYRNSGFAGLTVDASPFTGAGILLDVEDNNVEIDIGALPVGFTLARGDYLAFDYGTDSRALHRISAAAVADMSGQLTVEVRPFVRPGWSAGSPPTAIQFYRAAAEMIIVPGSWSDPVDVSRIGGASFEAVQTL